MRERLIELILACDMENEVLVCFKERPKNRQAAEIIAGYLLANGVIVPPCKVGDTVWIAGEYRGVYSAIVRTMFFSHSGVEMVRTTKCDIPFHDFGKVAFFTHEEAEKALAERRRNV